MKRPVLFGLLAGAVAGLLFACGSRTGLLVPDQEPAADTGPDVFRKKDVEPDVVEEPDVHGIDATERDAYKNDCPDAGSTLVYVVTDTPAQLLSFYPPDATFTLIGNLDCPSSPATAHPFSMAVDRTSKDAYVLYDDGEVFKVSTLDASCAATGFVRNQMGFNTFGMGFATVGMGPKEQLFIASAMASGELGTIDTTTYKVSSIGPLNVNSAELSGTGDGRLFAFYASTPGTAISEVDKTNGNLIGTDQLPSVPLGNAWAFAFWGGKFYLFTDPGSQDTWEYDPVSKASMLVTHYTAPIVGAGVSTCAPQ